MQGYQIVAALKGIANMTSLNTLDQKDKVAVRQLLDITNLCFCAPQYQVNARDLPHS